MLRPWGIALAWPLIVGSASAQEQQVEEMSRTIRELRISSRNVYSEEEADNNGLYLLFNKLHVPTWNEVILREIWFEPGERVTEQQVAELERNLRAIGWFGAADVYFEDTGQGDEADLVVETRDSFSLRFAGGLSLTGGVAGVNAGIGEANLFGSGKAVAFGFSRNDEGETSGNFSYLDKQLFGTWHRLDVTAGGTEEGHFFGVNVTRPFRHLADPFSYGVAASSVDRNVDYFEQGDSVAEVPLLRNAGGAFAAQAFGPRRVRSTIGLHADYQDVEYGPASGRDAAITPVPGDTRRFDLATSFSTRWEAVYQKVTGIDTLDYVEDLILGVNGTIRGGLALRDEDLVGTQVQPTLSGNVRIATMPLTDTYLTLEGRGSGRWHEGDVQGWDAYGAFHAFQRSLPAQTLAVSLTYEGAFEQQDLQPQFTLGEDNGLRGYPAREFAGDRVVRLNLEDRIDTGLEVLSMHLGLVAFFDVGWVRNRQLGLSFSDPIRSAGFGFRVGSSELLGDNVVRVDFGYPLDDVSGETYDLSVSFSAGQVFTFFGNSSSLRREF